jgi:hypothetical protein
MKLTKFLIALLLTLSLPLMAVLSTDTSRVQYTGNGIANTFPISFAFTDSTQIVVALVDSTTGVRTNQTNPTHYSVVSTNVVMVTAPANTSYLVIYRDVPRTQLVNLVEQDSFSAETLEESLDKSIMIGQQLSRRLDRSLRIDDTEADVLNVLPPALERANKILGFNSVGQPIPTTIAVGSGDLLAANNLSDVASAATALTNLGAQASDAELTAIAGLASAADRLPYFIGSGTASLAIFTAAGRAIVDDADSAAQRTSLGLGNSATRNVGTATGTVATGDDSRITGAIQSTEKAAANGVATLDAGTKIPAAQLPNPSSSSLGGVRSAANVARKVILDISTSGIPTVSFVPKDVINVRDYGAVGNGSTDDCTAINSAISALTNNSTLYFPAGKYRITSSLSFLSSLTGVTVIGDGWSSEIYNDSGSTGSNTFGTTASASRITIRDLAFTGTASVRGSGVHLRIASSYTEIAGCYFSGCSDFGVLVSYESGSWTSNVSVHGNMFYATLGDGVHVGSACNVQVNNNMFLYTKDDAIGIIADYAATPPNRIQANCNLIVEAGDAEGHGCGIRIAEGIDIQAIGNFIHGSEEAGIELGRYNSTTAYNSRVKIKDNQLYDCNQVGGSYGSIRAQFVYETSIENNLIDDPHSQSGIAFLDGNDLAVIGNVIRGSAASSAITTINLTTNVATTWPNIYIKNNICEYNTGYDTIYIVPGTGITISHLFIDGNIGNAVGTRFIYYDQVNTGRVVNNTTLTGTVSAGGTVIAVTTANNN